jgi:xanthine/uracil permease
LTTALGIAFMDIVAPTWFNKVLAYNGPNVKLQGFEQGINLVVETPFIIAAVIGVVLNLVLPYDGNKKLAVIEGHERRVTLPS